MRKFWKKLKQKQTDFQDTQRASVEPTTSLVPVDNGAPERALALSPHMQALWSTVFELVGVEQTQPTEFPGLFTVTPGAHEGEALVHIDVPSEEYVDGEPPRMDRIVTLSIRLDHDHRLFGDQYYCIDCDVPDSETRH